LHGGGPFEGFAITGGAFYNPAVQQFPAQFAGDYFFADFSNDWIHVRDAISGAVTEFATNAPGAVDLRVASDGSLYYLARNAGQAFRVNYPSLNQPPTISTIGNQTMVEDTTLAVPFTVGDAQMPPENLVVTAAADNQTLLPPGGLIVSGSGTGRTLEITPAADQSGSANVTVTVSDGSLSASASFFLIVSSESHPRHNPHIAFDVDVDGTAAANDALMIINLINAEGSGPLSPPAQGSSPAPFVDVTADNYLAPNDALFVINFLNAQVTAGEGEMMPASALVPATASDVLGIDDLLTADVAQHGVPRRRALWMA
jgi:hypothetical protein